MSESTAGAILVDAVSMRYGGREGILALDNIAFHVENGLFLSIFCPSGCGKSTLLMIIAGLVKSTAGRILVEGAAVRKPLTDVGIVFQQDLLFD